MEKRLFQALVLFSYVSSCGFGNTQREKNKAMLSSDKYSAAVTNIAIKEKEEVLKKILPRTENYLLH